MLTHWGRVTHICVGNLTIIVSDNGLSPDRRQAIIWTNAGLLSMGPLRIYFNENFIKIQQFSLKKMHVTISSAKWRPSCLGLKYTVCMIQKILVIIMTQYYTQHHTGKSRIRIVWYDKESRLSLQLRHNERDGVSNHQRLDCLLNRLFRRRSKKISNLRVTGLCEGNSSVTGEFPSQRASNAEKDSIAWRHHWLPDKESRLYQDSCSTGSKGMNCNEPI